MKVSNNLKIFWKQNCNQLEKIDAKFFLIGLAHIDLEAYYQLNFNMIQQHHWSLTEIENMIPYEREIYLTMLNEHVKQENKRMKEAQAKNRR